MPGREPARPGEAGTDVPGPDSRRMARVSPPGRTSPRRPGASKAVPSEKVTPCRRATRPAAAPKRAKASRTTTGRRRTPAGSRRTRRPGMKARVMRRASRRHRCRAGSGARGRGGPRRGRRLDLAKLRAAVWDGGQAKACVGSRDVGRTTAARRPSHPRRRASISAAKRPKRSRSLRARPRRAVPRAGWRPPPPRASWPPARGRPRACPRRRRPRRGC